MSTVCEGSDVIVCEVGSIPTWCKKMRTRSRIRGRFNLVGLASLLIGTGGGPCFADSEVVVSDELARLAEDEGFVVDGAANLEDASEWVDGGDVYRRVRTLLRKFDHIIVQGGQGGISRVIILGEKGVVPRPEPMDGEMEGAEGVGPDGKVRIVLETTRVGQQHSVDVSFETSSRGRLDKSMVIDTGASLVVLPTSSVKELGLDPAKLEEREIQTANGKVNARIGKLPAVWLGDRKEDGVEAAFIEDEKLGGTGLLGMSVLGRYQFTIDDEAQRLILTSRDQ